MAMAAISKPALELLLFRSCFVNSVRCFATVTGSFPLLQNVSVVRRKSLYDMQQTMIIPVRSASFFNRHTAEHLWKGVTGVSSAGFKRGRGKGIGKKRAKDLNKGQILGVGMENMVWPGLNAPIIRGREVVRQQSLPPDPARQERLAKLRDSMGVFRPLRVDPLERGYSGNKMPGRKLGPPEPIGGETFEDFDTRALEFKTVIHMTAVFGRKKSLSLFVVTGNKNGLAGFALAKANTAPSAIKHAKRRAVQKLLFIPRFNNHTVYHNFVTQFGKTKIIVHRRPEGHGLVCHRVIKSMCEVIGIRDIHAKVEGPCVVQSIVKAFFLGLIRQKSHQQLAEEKALHLVEYRAENCNLPKVMASPEINPVRTNDEISRDEDLDFDRYTMEGKLELKRRKFPRFYTVLPSYQIFLKKYEKFRNHEKMRHRLKLDYGEVRSFLSDKYPECRLPRKGERRKKMESET